MEYTLFSIYLGSHPPQKVEPIRVKSMGQIDLFKKLLIFDRIFFKNVNMNVK